MIIDPWGEVVARCEDPAAEDIAIAEIDLDWVNSVRSRMPLAQQTKTVGPGGRDATFQSMRLHGGSNHGRLGEPSLPRAHQERKVHDRP